MKGLLIFSCALVAVLGGGMPGGWSDGVPNEESRKLLLNLTAGTNDYLSTKEFTLVAVQSQVVAGMNYNFTLEKNGEQCYIQIYQMLDGTASVTKDTCLTLFGEEEQPVLGGQNSITMEELYKDVGAQKCMGQLLDKINANDSSNSMSRLVETKFNRATVQVVAGWMYRFQFHVGPSSNCTKSNMGLTGANCAVSSTDAEQGAIWNGTCWYQDWMTPDTKIQELTMKRAKKPEAHGEINDIDVIKQKLLGGDNHDKIPHGYNVLNGKVPNKPIHISVLGPQLSVQPPQRKLLGKDNHDLISHGKKLLGGDGHDLVEHGKKLLGGDGHDLVEHGKKLLGGDGHDLVDHVKKLIGGDDHDLINHGIKDNLKKLLGGDDHDLVDHVKKLIGGDDHDLIDHGKKLLGQDGHDFVNHVQQMLGGDTHDLVDRGKKLLGGDGHDYVDHGKKLLGKDGHDYVQHVSRQSLGKENKTKPLLGGDGHDLCHIGVFREFQATFQKQYGYGEEDKRFQIFCDNMRRARKFQKTEKGSARYGATQFADLTEGEFKQYVGKPWDLNANYKMKKAAIPKGSFPESFDWRDHNAVTPVKNQGSCGSCWAFSTTGNIEGQWAIKKGKLLSLSEQELVDCDKVDEGCNGGLPSQAYKEIERLGGLETEAEYSYKGEDEKCQFKKSDVKAFINDSVSISSNETEMAQWLATNGPISIGINAMAMQFYMGGIAHPWKIFCNPKDLDHGVLIVGYGVKDSEPYWIVKNSWGPGWGEKGYYLVYRGSGVCGLNAMCTSAVVD